MFDLIWTFFFQMEFFAVFSFEETQITDFIEYYKCSERTIISQEHSHRDLALKSL